MKSAKLVLIVIGVMLSFSASSEKYRFVAGDNSVGTKICLTALKDNVIRYHQKLKDYRVSKSYAANKLLCNDENLASFAQHFNALKIEKAVNRYRKSYVVIRVSDNKKENSAIKNLPKVAINKVAVDNDKVIVVEVRAAR